MAKAKVYFELDVSDLIEDKTIPDAINELEELIGDAIQTEWHYPDNMKIEIETE